ncbi:MAG: hypothetical protein LBF93_04710 [Zoogloeaceae bacterium]|nr:hypothetical protein [Zoogloeaceae bacterium]
MTAQTPPPASFLPVAGGRRRAAALCLLLALCLPSGGTLAAGEEKGKEKTAAEGESGSRTDYAPLDLAQSVPGLRTKDGTRTIFEPRPVRFTARLARLPEPQKADYLNQVMSLIGVTAKFQVSQRVVFDYGGDRPLAAYVEDGAAARIAKELKAGDTRTFYAFHVYNNRYGPALVVTAFDDE